MIANPGNNAPNAVRYVYLNGRAVDRVFHADDKKGEVSYYLTNEDGSLKAVGDEIATMTETGKVEIELNAGWRYDTVHNIFVLLPKHLLH